MPRRSAEKIDSGEERLAASWLADAEAFADRLAADEGPPPAADRASDAEEARYWGLLDPLVDHDEFKRMLRESGIPPQALQHLLLAETYPELLADYEQPVEDEELAEQLTTLAEHPFRAPLVLDWSEDDEERARRAEALDRAHEKLVAERMAAAMAQQGAAPATSGMPETPETPMEGMPMPMRGMGDES